MQINTSRSLGGQSNETDGSVPEKRSGSLLLVIICLLSYLLLLMFGRIISLDVYFLW